MTLEFLSLTIPSRKDAALTLLKGLVTLLKVMEDGESSR